MRHALRGTVRPNRKTHPVDDPLPDRHGLPPSENHMWDPVDLILTSTSRSSHNLSVTHTRTHTFSGEDARHGAHLPVKLTATIILASILYCE